MNARLGLIALLAVLAGLAGCTDHEGSIILEPADDEMIVNETSFSPRAVDYGLGNGPVHQVVVDAIANGSATYYSPYEGGEYYEHRPVSLNDGYYNISFDAVEEWDGYELAARLDYNASDLPDDRIQFENLSAGDQRELAPWLEWSNVSTIQSSWDAAIDVYYTPAERNESVLYTLNDTTAIEYDDEMYTLEVFRTAPAEDIRTFRATATEMTEDTAALASQVRDRYEFSFSSLSRGERNVLNNAKGEYYQAQTTDDQKFDSLVDKFMDHEAIRKGSASGEWLLRYDGESYWVDLHFGPFASS